MSKGLNYKLPPRSDKATVEDSIVHGRRLCAVGGLTSILEEKWSHSTQPSIPAALGNLGVDLAWKGVLYKQARDHLPVLALNRVLPHY